MPPVPAQEVPFKNEMGMVVRASRPLLLSTTGYSNRSLQKLVLPTISENYKRSHNEEDGKNAPTKPPSEDPPVDSNEA